MKSSTLVFLASLQVALMGSSYSQSKWTLYEETNLEGSISGTVQQGRIFKTASGSIYEVTGLTLQLVLELSPEVTVLQNGIVFKLIVDGFEEPLLCRQLKASGSTSSKSGGGSDAIESTISGTFEGWDGETVFVLDNGQIWQQSSYAYMYHYAYRPSVLIYKTSGGYKLRLEGVDETIFVKRLK